MLAPMVRRAFVAWTMAALAASVTTLAALADTATADLIPGPPAGSWEAYADETRPLTVADVYGSQAKSVKGFTDAYEKAWSEPGNGLVDQLERYSSVFWAAFHYGESQAAAKKNPSHASYTTVTGFGSGAYEVTDPADDQGYQEDIFVFTQGDYLAVIDMATKNARPDHTVLMDQARRQLAEIPLPVGEYNAIGSGVMTTAAIAAGVIGVVTILVGAIVLILVMRSRRQPAYAPVSAVNLNLSPDRRYWWDGQSWQDVAARIPPGASMSADGKQWWDGVTWRPSPPA